MVNTPDTATQKAYAAIALGFAARSCETKKLKWKDVIPMMHMEEEEDAVEKKYIKLIMNAQKQLEQNPTKSLIV